MSKKRKKLRFEVGEAESITQCLERMDKEGYRPTRRMEEPVFQEVAKNGKIEVVPVSQKIVFEGILKEEE
ncbi:NETI motif-containing protein [Alkalihalobacterium elongatum]|uniref:NETI motif-containing protein n=1 Tax=Alkalihalobacterium elongatum TaxID=2675466 RepID=UPI001C1F95DD|nr:NETI motif-containing protein [Alkalihalobacterium elongatum]